ncbi:hypothetical protein EST38_g14421 [Candolleomyces aberdarensis]|uniref:Uncharacterized protein n=1 Tax=Candolleomyces aberdarensis TaxID=2316362 RepID=A0A4Q2CZQ0_9AGAR|nr:hypothetical protein EST38_g14421 [Candolleomyces aberdarensis]
MYDALQQHKKAEWVFGQRASTDLMLLDPVRKVLFRVPWPHLKEDNDGRERRLTPGMILDFMRSRRMIWTCCCFSSCPLGHPMAEFVQFDYEEVRVYCANRLEPCGFYLNLNQIYMRTDLSFDFSPFRENQSYDDHLGVMADILRINDDTGIIEGWFGTYADSCNQRGIKVCNM